MDYEEGMEYLYDLEKEDNFHGNDNPSSIAKPIPIYYEEPSKPMIAVYWARYILSKLFGFIAGLFAMVLYFGGVAIHLWTIIIAFLNNGFIAAFITLCLPVISQLYWIWRSSVITGTIWNNYVIWIIIYIGSCLLVLLCGLIAVWLED